MNVTTWAVVFENYRAHVYRSDADSIGIPIVSTILSSIFALPFLAGIVLIPHFRSIRDARSRSAVAFTIAAAGLLVSYSVIALFGLAGLAYWAGPNHYLIAASYLCLLLLVGTLFILDFARLWSRRLAPRE